MKTKRLSLFLALIMMLSVFSGMFVVNAEETQNKWRIGETEYATWSDIPVEAFVDGVTVYMLADDTVSSVEQKTIGAETSISITIEGVLSGGNKPKLTLTNTSAAFWLRWDSTGTLTIKDIEINSTTTGTSSVGNGLIRVSSGTMNLQNMTISETAYVYYGLLIAQGGSINITDSSIQMGSSTSKDYTSSSGAVNATRGGILFYNKKNSTITVTNTTLSSENNTVKALSVGTSSITGNTAILTDCTISTSILTKRASTDIEFTLKGTNVINGYAVNADRTDGAVFNKDLDLSTLSSGTAMLEGAAVRAIEGDTELTNSGLRFMSTVSAAAIEAAGDGATLGTVIFRYSDYTAWKTNNADKTVAHFISDPDNKVLGIEANTGKVVNDDGSYTIFAAMVNVKDYNYGTDFGAVSYIKTADGVIVYSAFDEENNVRNITEVATAALADTNATQGYEEDGYKYNYLVSEGVYSPYTSAQRDVLNKYLGNN